MSKHLIATMLAVGMILSHCAAYAHSGIAMKSPAVYSWMSPSLDPEEQDQPSQSDE